MLFSFGGSFSFFVYIYLFLCIFDKIVISIMIPMQDNISFVFIVYLSGYYLRCVWSINCALLRIIVPNRVKSRHSVRASFYICHK